MTSATSGSRRTPPARGRSSWSAGRRTTRYVLERNDNYHGHEGPAAAGRGAPRRRAGQPAAPPGEGGRRLRAEPDQGPAGRHQGECRTSVPSRPEGFDLVHQPEPEEPEPGQARGARGAQVPGRLPGIEENILRGTLLVHQAFLPKGFLGAVDGQALQVRPRQGQGAAGEGRPPRRLQRDDGCPQHLADHRHRPGGPGELGQGRGSSSSCSRATASRSSPSTGRGTTTDATSSGGRTTRIRTATPRRSR